jgi:hypothetical protein
MVVLEEQEQEQEEQEQEEQEQEQEDKIRDLQNTCYNRYSVLCLIRYDIQKTEYLL